MSELLSCIIVDDEPQNQVVLEKMIHGFCPDVKVTGLASSVEEAIELIEDNTPDLVFLDIEMPGNDGFKLLDKFEAPPFVVVFTTAHSEYALKAIKYAALDYLLKPINLKELKLAIAKAKSRIKERNKLPDQNLKKFKVLKESSLDSKLDFEKIALSTDDGIQIIQIDDILWCEADKTYTIVHFVKGNQIKVSKLLKDVEALLPSSDFYRIHKSHIVNLDCITKYTNEDGPMVHLSDGTKLEVAVRRRQLLLTKLKQTEVVLKQLNISDN
ncbi:MAG: response regulator transcription factor [Crocinitomicaceae bacterium]|nr:response regulator transcription factor [Crocinitomicaceae bacterium]